MSDATCVGHNASNPSAAFRCSCRLGRVLFWSLGAQGLVDLGVGQRLAQFIGSKAICSY